VVGTSRTGQEFISDRELWARAGAGERAALGAVFERHADAVYTHSLAVAGSQVAAAELTSTVFVRAWRNHRRARLVDDSLLPWLLELGDSAAGRGDGGVSESSPGGLASMPTPARRATRRTLDGAVGPAPETTRRWKTRSIVTACLGLAVAAAGVAILVLVLALA
jgi:hypothetical protein